MEAIASWSFQLGPSSMTYSGDFILSKHKGVEMRMKHGIGIMRWPDGREYRGEFRRDKMHGEGIMSWPTGAKYVGQYYNNQKEGYGKLTMPDGSTWEGQFHNGRKHGVLLHIAPDGFAKRMEFDSDHLISSSLEDVPAELVNSFERDPDAPGCVGDFSLEPGYDIFIKSEEPTDVEDGAQCSEPTCCICLGELSGGDTCCETACKHVFHKECMDAWVKQKNHCPLCVRKIPLRRVCPSRTAVFHEECTPPGCIP